MPRRAARADPPHTRGPPWRNSAGRRPVSCDSCPSPAQPKSDGNNSEAPRKNRTTKFSNICAYTHKVRGWGETSTRGMAWRPAEPRIANAVERMRPNPDGSAAAKNGRAGGLTVRGRRPTQREVIRGRTRRTPTHFLHGRVMGVKNRLEKIYLERYHTGCLTIGGKVVFGFCSDVSENLESSRPWSVY
jgi:hypothetical protein